MADELTEQVIRGDLKLVKVGEGDQGRMAGVPFLVTSATTGESHTIVTDANGCASTAASWNPHTADTNGGTAESGVWFGGDGQGGGFRVMLDWNQKQISVYQREHRLKAQRFSLNLNRKYRLSLAVREKRLTAFFWMR